jgi:hypothetical protein
MERNQDRKARPLDTPAIVLAVWETQDRGGSRSGGVLSRVREGWARPNEALTGQRLDDQRPAAKNSNPSTPR